MDFFYRGNTVELAQITVLVELKSRFEALLKKTKTFVRFFQKSK
jgi:hypothetical protein